jgi:UDP-glucose 4-epimerase
MVDLADPSPVAPSVFDGCSAVIHLAAYIPRRQADPAEAKPCLDTNALGTLRLLQAADEAGVQYFVHTSSANAYISGVSSPAESAAMFPIERASYYLTSKLAQEIYGANWGFGHAMRIACLRLSSVYGPGQTNGALVAMGRALLRGEQVNLVNGGQFGADFVFVDDVVNALLAVLRAGSEGSYNVGSGQRSTMAHIVAHLARLAGAEPAQVTLDPAPLALDAGFPALDIGKAREAFGYAPKPVELGIPLFLDWLKASATA